ncbi:MAG TPA: hypothetical protein VN822_08435 [Candidatus Acidoferrales bacterium]|nr:hypothetical protein [Candidatus Acidoferrales bacterium]
MAPADHIGQRGGAKISFLLMVLVLGSLGFTGYKVVPVYFANYQFQDAVQDESRFALTGYPKKSTEDIREDIWKKVQELEIPAKRDDIRVVVSEGKVDIGLDYSVPIDLKVYQFTLQFHPHADNHTI